MSLCTSCPLWRFCRMPLAVCRHDELCGGEVFDRGTHGLEQDYLILAPPSSGPPRHQVRQLALDALAPDEATLQWLQEVAGLGQSPFEGVDEEPGPQYRLIVHLAFHRRKPADEVEKHA